LSTIRNRWHRQQLEPILVGGDRLRRTIVFREQLQQAPNGRAAFAQPSRRDQFISARSMAALAEDVPHGEGTTADRFLWASSAISISALDLMTLGEACST